MKKVLIDSDEAYPVYGIYDGDEPHHATSYYDAVVEVPEEVYEKWVGIISAYHDLQEELHIYVKDRQKDI